jgi:hypothetical protein
MINENAPAPPKRHQMYVTTIIVKMMVLIKRIVKFGFIGFSCECE